MITKTHIYTLREDGILEAKTNPDWTGIFELEDAHVFVESVIKISKGKKRPLLVLASNGKIDRKARMHTSNESHHALKVAFVGKNSIASLMGNFFLGFNKPKVPFKLFKNEDDAIHWLKE